MRIVAGVLPRMGSTERVALEAGTVWWDGELFSGAPRWQRLLDFQPRALSEREREFLEGPVEQLCRRLDDWQISQDGDLPPELWSFIKEKGFLGMIIPEKYGGLGFSAIAHSAVVVKAVESQRHRGGDGHGAQLARSGRAAAPLRNPGAEGPPAAAPCPR